MKRLLLLYKILTDTICKRYKTQVIMSYKIK